METRGVGEKRKWNLPKVNDIKSICVCVCQVIVEENTLKPRALRERGNSLFLFGFGGYVCAQPSHCTKNNN